MIRKPAPGRTPLFQALRRAARLAAQSRQPGAPPLDELVGRVCESRSTAFERSVGRRTFLKQAGAATAGFTLAPTLWGCRSAPSSSDPRIVIVGGGVAGLNAAYQLRKSGLTATVFDAGNRTGGRMFTATNLVGDGYTTELGGEFIDSGHDDILGLAEEFGLELYDRHAPENDAFLPAYFFEGRHYSEAEVIAAFAPLAERIQADFDSTEDIVDFEHEGNAGVLDNTSIAEYLDGIGAEGFIRALLESAYVTEYGLEADEQSALNLIYLIGTDASDGFKPFGDSDERLKVVGGNQRIVDALAERLPGQTELGKRLEAVRPRGSGYRLTFATDGGPQDVDADLVLLALPFTMLRTVELTQLALPDFKTRAINELGYGTNAKVFAGTNGRPWRSGGYSGECFTDEAFQLCWDNTELQPGTGGALTFYSGGAAGLVAGEGTAEDQVARLLPGAERVFPGVAAALNGKTSRFHWPTHPFTKASYACYRPGQWTSIAGAEGRAVGNLFFAGEHCSYDFQGYMNGGAETGRRAAEEILAALGLLKPTPAPSG